MTAEYIYKCARACAGVYGTAEPDKIFEMRGVPIKTSKLGGIRGMICVKGGEMLVYVDENAVGSSRRVSSAKLLGHCFLHRERLLHGESFEDSASLRTTEDREAGFFAAELLISDACITELCTLGYTEGQLASALGGLRELVSYKVFSMRSRKIPVCGDVCRTDFLNRCDVDLFF